MTPTIDLDNLTLAPGKHASALDLVERLIALGEVDAA